MNVEWYFNIIAFMFTRLILPETFVYKSPHIDTTNFISIIPIFFEIKTQNGMLQMKN